jgi:hypothetical protein
LRSKLAVEGREFVEILLSLERDSSATVMAEKLEASMSALWGLVISLRLLVSLGWEVGVACRSLFAFECNLETD